MRHLISLVVFIVLIFAVFMFIRSSPVVPEAETSECYVFQGKPRVDLDLTWNGDPDEQYSIVYENEIIPVDAKEMDDSIVSSLTLDVEDCSMRVETMMFGADNTYVPVNLSIRPSKRDMDYNLYMCDYEYRGVLDKGTCFVSNKSVEEGYINLHGEYAGGSWTNLFLVLDECADCPVPKYLELETSTLSSTKCTLEVNIDLNDIGKYNEMIYPEDPMDDLKAKEIIDVPVKSHIKDGIRSFKISPNPSGCNMNIEDIRFVYR